MPLVRHPDRREIAASMQTGQLERVTPVGLDLVTGALGSATRHHDARDPHHRQLTMQRVAGRTSLVCNPENSTTRRQAWSSTAESPTGWWQSDHDPELLPLVGDGHHNRVLVDIQPTHLVPEKWNRPPRMYHAGGQMGYRA